MIKSICKSFLFGAFNYFAIVSSSLASDFVNLCQEKSNLSPDIQLTIESILKSVETSSCSQAETNIMRSKRLILSGYGIKNLSPIKLLPSIEILDLNNNKISDITPLKLLTRLRKLSLTNNLIIDIKPLESLTKLTDIGITGNRITDISPLRNMTDLNVLSANRNQISEVSFLRFNTKLEKLFLAYNQITDIMALKSLINLKVVLFRGNPIVHKTCPFADKDFCGF